MSLEIAGYYLEVSHDSCPPNLYLPFDINFVLHSMMYGRNMAHSEVSQESISCLWIK